MDVDELGQLVHSKAQTAVGVQQPCRAACAGTKQDDNRAQSVFKQAAEVSWGGEGCSVMVFGCERGFQAA